MSTLKAHGIEDYDHAARRVSCECAIEPVVARA